MPRSLVAFAVFLLVSGVARAGSLDQKVADQIDEAARAWLMRSGAPSVSIAVVQDGTHIYAKACGSARLNPTRPATSQTRYAIHSVSKQFTAAAILLLAEQEKLSLDDKIERWFPDLGAAGQVTIQQILTHTSGIRDFWRHDFLSPEMVHPKAPSAIIAEWAAPPLDFEPGSDWHYSNTGYVIAGAIVEKVSGEALVPFLHAHVFAPLKMTGVTEDDSGPLPIEDAGAYTRYGTGSARPAPKEGAGWPLGPGELAMNARDLALWDISLIDRALLKPESYVAAFTPAALKDGKNAPYGPGLFIDDDQGHPHISHMGAGSGFHAENHIWPDDKTAIVVLTNSDWTDPSALVDQIAFAVLPSTPEVLRAPNQMASWTNSWSPRRAIDSPRCRSHLRHTAKVQKGRLPAREVACGVRPDHRALSRRSGHDFVNSTLT